MTESMKKKMRMIITASLKQMCVNICTFAKEQNLSAEWAGEVKRGKPTFTLSVEGETTCIALAGWDEREEVPTFTFTIALPDRSVIKVDGIAMSEVEREVGALVMMYLKAPAPLRVTYKEVENFCLKKADRDMWEDICPGITAELEAKKRERAPLYSQISECKKGIHSLAEGRGMKVNPRPSDGLVVKKGDATFGFYPFVTTNRIVLRYCISGKEVASEELNLPCEDAVEQVKSFFLRFL